MNAERIKQKYILMMGIKLNLILQNNGLNHDQVNWQIMKNVKLSNKKWVVEVRRKKVD